MKSDPLDIVYYLILAAIAVLIIMNAKNFAIAVGSIFSGANSTLGVISGSSYGKAA